MNIEQYPNLRAEILYISNAWDMDSSEAFKWIFNHRDQYPSEINVEIMNMCFRHLEETEAW